MIFAFAACGASNQDDYSAVFGAAITELSDFAPRSRI